MRTSYQFFQAILAAFLLLAFVADSQAQQQSAQRTLPRFLQRYTRDLIQR